MARCGCRSVSVSRARAVRWHSSCLAYVLHVAWVLAGRREFGFAPLLSPDSCAGWPESPASTWGNQVSHVEVISADCHSVLCYQRCCWLLAQSEMRKLPPSNYDSVGLWLPIFIYLFRLLQIDLSLGCFVFSLLSHPVQTWKAKEVREYRSTLTSSVMGIPLPHESLCKNSYMLIFKITRWWMQLGKFRI